MLIVSYLQKITLPPQFIKIQEGHRAIIARQGWEDVVRKVMGRSGEEEPFSISAYPVFGGRGGAYFVSLANGGRGVMRQYLRGGFVRHFVRELYWGWLPRPLVELVCTEEIRRRGVPVVDILGAWVEQVGGFFYRGATLTREAVGFINFWEWLNNSPQGRERRVTVCEVARAIKHMHDAGVDHRDLNLTNILVRWTGRGAEVSLIDFDRVRLQARPLGLRRRRRNLIRLRRSLHKLDPVGRVSAAVDVKLFCQAYREGH